MTSRLGQRNLGPPAWTKSIVRLNICEVDFSMTLQPRTSDTVVLSGHTPNPMRQPVSRNESRRPKRAENETVRNVTPR